MVLNHLGAARVRTKRLPVQTAWTNGFSSTSTDRNLLIRPWCPVDTVEHNLFTSLKSVDRTSTRWSGWKISWQISANIRAADFCSNSFARPHEWSQLWFLFHFYIATCGMWNRPELASDLFGSSEFEFSAPKHMCGVRSSDAANQTIYLVMTIYMWVKEANWVRLGETNWVRRTEGRELYRTTWDRMWLNETESDHIRLDHIRPTASDSRMNHKCTSEFQPPFMRWPLSSSFTQVVAIEQVAVRGANRA